MLTFRCSALVVVDREDAGKWSVNGGWVVIGRGFVQEHLGRAQSLPLSGCLFRAMVVVVYGVVFVIVVVVVVVYCRCKVHSTGRDVGVGASTSGVTARVGN